MVANRWLAATGRQHPACLSELSISASHFGIAPDKIENCRTYGGHGEQMAVYASTAKVDGKPLLDIIGTPALTKEQWVEIQTQLVCTTFRDKGGRLKHQD